MCVSDCQKIPDAKTRFSGFSMFKVSLSLDEDFLYGISILYHNKRTIVNIWDVTLCKKENQEKECTLKT